MTGRAANTPICAAPAPTTKTAVTGNPSRVIRLPISDSRRVENTRRTSRSAKSLPGRRDTVMRSPLGVWTVRRNRSALADQGAAGDKSLHKAVRDPVTADLLRERDEGPGPRPGNCATAGVQKQGGKESGFVEGFLASMATVLADETAGAQAIIVGKADACQ